MGLYHKEIGFPQGLLQSVVGPLRLTYSQHARLQCVRDRYGVIDKPPFKIDIKPEQVIEIETDDSGTAVKSVVRIPYNENFDLVLAVKTDGFVKTVWLNSNKDQHSTLRADQYDKP